ncbi:hypothetical protein ACFWH4_01330 [Streptomyces sp. NPDC127091]
MSETFRVAFGICALIGGTAGLVAAFIVWQRGRRTLADLRKRLDLPKSP